LAPYLRIVHLLYCQSHVQLLYGIPREGDECGGDSSGAPLGGRYRTGYCSVPRAREPMFFLYSNCAFEGKLEQLLTSDNLGRMLMLIPPLVHPSLVSCGALSAQLQLRGRYGIFRYNSNRQQIQRCARSGLRSTFFLVSQQLSALSPKKFHFQFQLIAFRKGKEPMSRKSVSLCLSICPISVPQRV
jgi:hypothetical protein